MSGVENKGAEREEKALMPRSAPPPAGLPPRPSSAAPMGPVERRAGRGRCSPPRRARVRHTRAQLHALEHDIETARTSSHRAPEGVGSLLHRHHDPPPASLHGERVRLRDGAEIVIRPIEPEDAGQLRAGFERLGAVSRYRRFLTKIDHLTRTSWTT